MNSHHDNLKQRLGQLVRRVLGGFVILAYSWFLMMAIHEAGHIAAAWATGGTVQKIQLQPLAISRTDIHPNPSRLFVVWAGPVVGALLPVFAFGIVPIKQAAVRQHLTFFAGFCLIANGTYIAAGSFDQVGDCKVMLQEGSPTWALLLFGAITVPAGFWQWHRMGSFLTFLTFPDFASVDVTWTTAALLILVAIQLAASFS